MNKLGTLETEVQPVNQPQEPVVPPTPAPAPAPTPKPEPKPAEAPQAEGEEKWPRTSADWKKFTEGRKKEREELSSKIAELTKDRDTLNEKLKGLSSFQETPEYKALVKERDEYSERLRMVEVTQHPKFKAHFDGRVNEQIALAKSIVGDGKADEVAKILSLPNGEWRNQQLRNFVSELDVYDQSRLGAVVNALSVIDAQKEAAINEAKTSYAALTESQKRAAEQAKLQQQSSIQKLIDDGIKGITDSTKGNPVFQKRDGDDKWNAAVEKRIETVKGLLTGEVSPQDIFKTAVNAVAYHQVLSDMQEMKTENDSLKKQIEKLTAAQPSITPAGRGGNGNGPAPKMPVKPGMNPREATHALVKSLWESPES